MYLNNKVPAYKLSLNIYRVHTQRSRKSNFQALLQNIDLMFMSLQTSENLLKMQ